MKKIPTIFERDWNGDRSRVINQVHPGCEWVLAGEGIATRKLDGSCCRVQDGKLLKRREIRIGRDRIPDNLLPVDSDIETSKIVGWVPVGDGPEDKYHREAFTGSEPNGNYELIGPKIQGNPERATAHTLVPHGQALAGPVVERESNIPRSFGGLRDWLIGMDIEGLVFHHPDGRMAKIKLRDFGLRRGAA